MRRPCTAECRLLPHDQPPRHADTSVEPHASYSGTCSSDGRGGFSSGREGGYREQRNRAGVSDGHYHQRARHGMPFQGGYSSHGKGERQDGERRAGSYKGHHPS